MGPPVAHLLTLMFDAVLALACPTADGRCAAASGAHGGALPLQHGTPCAATHVVKGENVALTHWAGLSTTAPVGVTAEAPDTLAGRR